jgi:alpha-L-glutamate ligase-like protein
VIAGLRRLRAEVLGLNRRNHAYLFAYNPRDRYRVVDDKRETKAALAAHGVPAPALHAVSDAPWQARALVEQLADIGEFVLKPARGAGGAGIVVVVGRRDGRFLKASGAVLAARDLEAHACDVIAGAYSPGGRGDVLLVEQRLVPDPVLGALAYRGVPDVRVIVFRGVPLLAMLRVPTRRSDGRANLHLGGIGVGIDLADGRTTYGVRGRVAIDVHPDLGVRLDGVVVPAWDDVLSLAGRAADAIGLGFVGVDVVIDGRRGPLVLELNARPGLTIQLANRRGLRPLLDAVAGAAPPATPAGRVALGRELSSRRAGS